MMSDYPVWPGSGSAVSGSTPYGYYDDDPQFQSDAPKVAKWCATRLGYPTVDIELKDLQFYACFEEAVNEYSSLVNEFNIRENMLTVKGASTSSNFTQRNLNPNQGRVVQLASQYGTEAGAGGNVDWKMGYIETTGSQQVYDLDQLWGAVSESNKRIEVKRIFHYKSPAIMRYFDPYLDTGLGYQNQMAGFGWGDMTPAVQYIMMPMYADLLRVQAIELNDQIRKSAYSFELINNKLRLFPKPKNKIKVWFQYIVKEDRDNPLQNSDAGEISDYSNVPYQNIGYEYINSVGKQWIRKYTLALAKELLGSIRSKYSNIPIPDAEIALDGDTLKSEAADEKQSLREEIRDTLEQTSRRAQLEKKRDEDENLISTLKNTPLQIYIG